MSLIEEKLQQLNLILPQSAVPVANYLPYTVHHDCVYISGQLPMHNGVLQYTGPVTTVEIGQQAAQLCALNILAQLKTACVNLDKVTHCIRLGGFVHCGAHFFEHSQVMNGASEIMVKLWDAKGRHVRAVVGCNSLPLNAMIEIEAIFAIK